MREYSTTQQKLHAVTQMWVQWVVTYGAATLAVLVSTLVPSPFMPMFVAALALAMQWTTAWPDPSHYFVRNTMTRLVVNALWLSAAVMVSINLGFHTRFMSHWFNPSTANTTIPFIASLIIYPTIGGMMIAAHIVWHMRHIHRHGQSPEEGFVGNFKYLETKRQLRIITVLALFTSAVCWTYYAIFYINVNLNAPDKFFFVAFPIGLYVSSLIYFGRHYYSVRLELLVRPTSTPDLNEKDSVLRYLIIRDDKLLLKPDEHQLFDTPAEVLLRHPIKPTQQVVNQELESLTGLTPEQYSIRELYHNPGNTIPAMIYHYLVTLPDNAPEKLKTQGQWATLATINRLMAMHAVAPAFGAEIHRVLTSAMAWKTYTRTGHRLYPIKNYRPTFRLCDINRWPIDYNDSVWMKVARNNQDKAMWHIVNLWKKCTRQN